MTLIPALVIPKSKLTIQKSIIELNPINKLNSTTVIKVNITIAVNAFDFLKSSCILMPANTAPSEYKISETAKTLLSEPSGVFKKFCT